MDQGSRRETVIIRRIWRHFKEECGANIKNPAGSQNPECLVDDALRGVAACKHLHQQYAVDAPRGHDAEVVRVGDDIDARLGHEVDANYLGISRRRPERIAAARVATADVVDDRVRGQQVIWARPDGLKGVIRRGARN